MDYPIGSGKKEYPKRGGDCIYDMDCMWGTDGFCDRPKDWEKCILDKEDEVE